MAIITGWHAAADRSGLPRTSLRRLVEHGELKATKTEDGTWTFDSEELDAVRAVRGGPARAEVDRGNASEANETLDDLDVEVTEENDEHTEVAPRRSLGAAPSTNWLYDATTAAPETEIIYVETVRSAAQLAAAIEPWRIAWRRARVTQIANAIGAEAATAGASPYAAWCASCAAGSAVEQLDDATLASDHAYAAARAAGQYAAASVAWHEAHASAWWHAEIERQEREQRRREREEDELDDLERARRRRRAMRTRW